MPTSFIMISVYEGDPDRLKFHPTDGCGSFDGSLVLCIIWLVRDIVV